mmetsp:Transcript_10891/g.27408  ORF Transcript_10891/g.27408 Transcript_10891/m.27408 type:complete len:97 (-) Transcript_10891:20-310(-)
MYTISKSSQQLHSCPHSGIVLSIGENRFRGFCSLGKLPSFDKKRRSAGVLSVVCSETALGRPADQWSRVSESTQSTLSVEVAREKGMEGGGGGVRR